jgi:hypothetical protein
MTEDRVLTAIAAEGLAPAKSGIANFYRDRAANGIQSENRSQTMVHS